MYQRIMVPVDDSTASLYALKEAGKLAKQLGAAVLAVHVVDLGQFNWGAPAYTDAAAVRKAVEEAGVKVLERAKQELDALGVAHDALQPNTPKIRLVKCQKNV